MIEEVIMKVFYINLFQITNTFQGLYKFYDTSNSVYVLNLICEICIVYDDQIYLI